MMYGVSLSSGYPPGGPNSPKPVLLVYLKAISRHYLYTLSIIGIHTPQRMRPKEAPDSPQLSRVCSVFGSAAVVLVFVLPATSFKVFTRESRITRLKHLPPVCCKRQISNGISSGHHECPARKSLSTPYQPYPGSCKPRMSAKVFQSSTRLQTLCTKTLPLHR